MPAIFEQSSVTDVLEGVIAKVDALEETEQKKLLKVFRNVRRELMDRLYTIPEGTFSEQQLRVTLVQIQAAIETIKRDLKGQMVVSSEILANKGVSDLAREINLFDKKFLGAVQPLSIDSLRIATDTNNFLINKYEASIDAYSEALRSQITGSLINAMATRETTELAVGRLVADVGRFFLGEEWKISRIARTELHGVYNYAKMNTLGDIQGRVLPDLKKTLYHPMDKRTGEDSKLLNAKAPVVDIDKPFRFKYRGVERVFNFPPDRPNDRAILVPYRAVWEDS